MGLYQKRKMAIYYWSCLLIIGFCSIAIFVLSVQLLKSSSIHIDRPLSVLQTPKLTMDDWLQLTQEFHLHLLRFRPRPMGGFDIGIKGKYQNLLYFLKNLQKHYPEITWHKILLEQRNDILMMQLEVG